MVSDSTPMLALSQFRQWSFAVLFAVMIIGGCSGRDELPRKQVFGTVSSSSNALDGAISFLPAAGTKGPSATTAIVQGKYRFAAGDGVVPGKYQVLIVPKLTKPIPQPGSATKPHSTSEPTEFRQEATVSADGPFELNFQVGS